MAGAQTEQTEAAAAAFAQAEVASGQSSGGGEGSDDSSVGVQPRPSLPLAEPAAEAAALAPATVRQHKAPGARDRGRMTTTTVLITGPCGGLARRRQAHELDQGGHGTSSSGTTSLPPRTQR